MATDRPEPPQELMIVGILMLVSGIQNLVFTLVWMLTGFVLGLQTCGIGCVCCVLPLFTAAASVAEFLGAIKILQGQRDPNLRTYNLVGLIGSCLSLSVVGIVMEAIAFVFLSNDKVKAYLESREEYVPWTGEPKKLG